MRALGLRPIQFTFAILAAAAVAVALLLLGNGTTEASHGATAESSFNVTYSATPSTLTPGADRGLTTVFSVPFPGNINFGNLITFDPGTVTQTCNSGLDGSGRATTHTAGGPCLRSTDLVGTLSSLTDLAFANNSCGTAGSLTIPFDLFAVPTPDNPADPRASTNIAYTQPEGAGSRFGRWGVEADKTLPTDDFIPVGGGTAVTYTLPAAVQAEATNVMFKNYPEYLLDLFDKDGETSPGKPLVPTAVYGGLTKVGGTPVPLYFVYFAPGALAAEFSAPDPLSRATTNLGYASQTVLNDPTPPVGNPSAVTAFCATTSTTVLSPTVGGVSRAKNPATAGTHFDLAWAASQRDLDNDGVENGIDTCPSDVDTDGDPRPFGNDPDFDNIDGACDTVANGTAGNTVNDGSDFDSDTWLNQADNCPLVTNAGQVGSEIALGVAPGYAAGRAADGGPLGDSLGDACDSEIGAKVYTYNGIATTITTSDTIANGRWQARGLVVPKCYGGVDADGDGYCTTEDSSPSDPTRWRSWTGTAAINAVLGNIVTLGAGSWDTDAAGSDPITGGDFVPDNAFDSDWLETYLGTDARQPCALTTSTADEPLDAWIYDTDGDGKATLFDVLGVAPYFNKPALFAGAASKRYDWDVDGFVTLFDVLQIAPAFNGRCLPVVVPQ